MPSPDAPWDDRVRYAVDAAGRYFTYRPDELIVHVDALDDLADLVADEGRGVPADVVRALGRQSQPPSTTVVPGMMRSMAASRSA